MEAREDLSSAVSANSVLERIVQFLKQDALYTGIGGIAGAAFGVATAEALQAYADGLRDAPVVLRVAIDVAGSTVYGGIGAAAGFGAANLIGIYRFLRYR